MESTKNKNKWTILTIVVISMFMASLDSSIVNVALPKMAKDLNVETSNIQLVVTSYLVVIAGLVLIFGRLGDMLGKTKVFKFGLGLFTFGSLLCGITSSFPLLIIARIIQATGAAGTMANNQGIIAEVFPKNERGKALGLSATTVALGSLVGPGLGGLIVGTASWEFIFLINVPIGLVALFFAFKLFPEGHKIAKGKLDGIGSILLILTIVPLFVALSQGLSRSFTDPIILLGFIVAISSFIAFIIVEKKRENPLVELQMFKNKLFSLSIFCAFTSFVAIFCNNIILPFYLQDVMSYTPQHAGLILMIYPLILTVVAPISGHLSDKIGSEILTFIGLVLTSLGLMLMSTLNENSVLLSIVMFMGTMSIGVGLFQSPNNSLIMSTVAKDKLGIAGSINALIRNLGMVCGIALATTLLYSRMSYKIGYRVTDYVVGRNDVFIYGMKTVYIAASIICFVGTILTFFRLIRKK
ncbi:drug resistance transporter, EmrB/QacA family [Gottschalkia acidurici 9a]|uniref:Drug resistance transporter, EmrB/QacA family n=1 Tax=Gottschalkia acidurici (strain ATCC 7906 / DSM 604 / BCRC 14475 / CIP 104303 / KCTC 5404 / NCIMB 10678 / 9a) TaxID=1128398 RepID=K0B4C3_GOTA9|nr:MFS transporter [Gottschalkia acidurici]AFS79785.1 drug resistance transporter, EmrB/QacA family [Gottschalkia acidurici 9a]